MLRIVAAFVCGLTLAHGQHFKWEQAPYGNDGFNTKATYLSTVNLTCDSPDNRTDFLPQYWVLPTMDILEDGQEKTFKTLDGMAGWVVHSNGTKILAYLIYDYHFGFYYCHGISVSTGTPYVVKRAINYDGPHFTNLWEVYRMPTIVGCSAAGATLLIFIIAFLVDTFHYRSPERKAERMARRVAKAKANNGEIHVISEGADPDYQTIPGGVAKSNEYIDSPVAPAIKKNGGEHSGVDNVAFQHDHYEDIDGVNSKPLSTKIDMSVAVDHGKDAVKNEAKDLSSVNGQKDVKEELVVILDGEQNSKKSLEPEYARVNRNSMTIESQNSPPNTEVGKTVNGTAINNNTGTAPPSDNTNTVVTTVTAKAGDKYNSGNLDKNQYENTPLAEVKGVPQRVKPYSDQYEESSAL